MDIFPLYDKILVEEDKQSSTTAGGIIIEGYKGESKTYTVLAIGEECKRIKVGNKIFFDLTKCNIVVVAGKHYALVSECNVLAVIVE